jgi:predicted branched-subunit amino acid permease
MNSRLTEFTRGVRAELPILVGVAPFGMIFGVLALEAGLSHLQAQSMSAIVFAGSSQIVFAQLVHLGAPGWVIVLTTAVVNLRHALYSASMAPYVQRLKPAWKWLLSYLLTDECYAVTVIYYQSQPDPLVLAESEQRIASVPDLRHWFYLGAGLALWSCWQLSTAAGIFLGAIVPQSWSLDFTLALTFIALVVPNLNDRPALVTALIAGLVALLAYPIPYKLGLMVAALVGILCGLLVEAKA